MSRQCSLNLLFPGVPASFTNDRVVEFALELSRIGICPPEQGCNLEADFGKSPDSDLLEMGEIEGVDSLQEYASEIDQRFPPVEAAVQRLVKYDQIYRLYLGFGLFLRKELQPSFYVEGPDSETYVCLDGFNLYVGPISPSTLSCETEEPLGFVAVSFSGSGYFTWTANNERVVYDRIVALPEVQRVSQVCRKFFPVSEDLVRGKFSDSIGKLWLNRNEWKEGDWIWTITENG